MKTAIAISPMRRNVLSVATIPPAAVTASHMTRIAPRIVPMIRPMSPVCTRGLWPGRRSMPRHHASADHRHDVVARLELAVVGEQDEAAIGEAAAGGVCVTTTPTTPCLTASMRSCSVASGTNPANSRPYARRSPALGREEIRPRALPDSRQPVLIQHRRGQSAFRSPSRACGRHCWLGPVAALVLPGNAGQ